VTRMKRLRVRSGNSEVSTSRHKDGCARIVLMESQFCLPRIASEWRWVPKKTAITLTPSQARRLAAWLNEWAAKGGGA